MENKEEKEKIHDDYFGAGNKHRYDVLEAMQRYGYHVAQQKQAEFIKLIESSLERCKKELAESTRKMNRQNSDEFKATYRLHIAESQAAIEELTDLLIKSKTLK